MSDSFLQLSGQHDPNESEVFIHDSKEGLPGVTIETITPVIETEISTAHFHQNILGETNNREIYYKMSEDSLDLISGQESPIGVKQSMLGYLDTDSCLSISPSPDPDSKIKTFDFSMIDPTGDKSNLSAAIQMEQEFLDFMFSLPQIQNEAIAKEHTKSVVSLTPKKCDILNKNFDKKIALKAAQPVCNTSRVGLDHLDNLCRMMEQLGELKEQNTRLQRRVQYLEELKTLQEMHRDMQDSIAARKSALSLGSVSLSDSDLLLEDINKSCAYLLDSEESLDQSVSLAKSKDQMLELPDLSVAYQRHSSSEDDRRVKDDSRRSSDKEKKGHKSAWGKVKHMISYNSKRENVRKKSSGGVETSQKVSPMLAKSMSVSKTCGQDAVPTGTTAEGTGISDPEEYDLEYESMDPDGTSWEWEGDCEGGIWMGPKNNNDTAGNFDPCLLTVGDGNFLGVKRNKPQLTITVPSNENLHNVQRNDNSRLSAELKSSPGSSSPSKFDLKSSPDLSTTPPSPRRFSNWSKVKHAFLTGPGQNQQNQIHSSNDNDIINNRQQQTSNVRQYRLQNSNNLSMPPSPNKKKQLQSNFSFDVGSIQGPDESDSPSGISPEISPDDILLPTHHRQSKGRRRGGPNARHGSLPSSVVHKNLIDLQRTLTGEFNKKLQEWERLKSHQGIYGGNLEAGRGVEVAKTSLQNNAGESLPQEFRKKLHEWEKMKGREKEKQVSRSNETRVHVNAPLLHLYHNHQSHQITQDDLKTKIHDEDDLPPDFKKKLTEWEIRKALVGKGRQNVEQLQKNLGEEFNKKMAEWERMKSLSQGKMGTQGIPETTMPTTSENSSDNLLAQGRDTPSSPLGGIRLTERTSTDEGSIILGEPIPVSSRLSHITAASQNLDRKGSAHKIKKSKSGKPEKAPLAKSEGQKHRDKELLWLEKELHKIDREKQRLEREKEKFLEREARLEKMRHAMRQGPAEKKEIYIKTSTGEFRFEGISQTFTKKLYEWEERRGIRPESSTFVLLDPNYRAPEKENENDISNHSPEAMRIIRSRSESSLAERGQTGGMTSVVSHQSSISLNDMEKEDNSAIQAENKSVSEPTLSADDATGPSKCAVLVQMEELVDEVEVEEEEEEEEERKQSEKMEMLNERGRSLTSVYQDPYAPAEITRLIDSSGSEDNLKRPPNEIDEEIAVVSTNGIIITNPVTFVTEPNNLRRTDSQRSEESYRSLLHENMTLLGRLKEQETLCRALETQMGDIDTKMDNVADQHLKTLEKLHRQVTIMKKSESSSRMLNKIEGDSSDEAESNQRLIAQLKARIVELELKGDKLMAEKEELECEFKLHKSHETQIAESLLLRIRELQDAGAEVNIQTVQCQTEESLRAVESDEPLKEAPKLTKIKQELNIPSTSTAITPTTQTPSSTTATGFPPVKKKRRKRRDEYCKNNENDESEDDKNESEEETEKRRNEKDGKEHQKRKRKIPPKKVQKLHNLTADLLFQAKRLEGALVSKHNLSRGNQDRSDAAPPKLPRKRSLKGRSSLRLSKEEKQRNVQRKPPKGPNTTRTWSSIEAIVSSGQENENDRSSNWETRAAALASESQDLLAMNAELSRMAKELRKEMMSVWSFRESTSPESNSSDTREETIKSKISLSDLKIYNDDDKNEEETKQESNWLDDEAREVFDSIAALHPLGSECSEILGDSIENEISGSEDKEKIDSPPTESVNGISLKEEHDNSSEGVTDNIIQSPVESEEHFQSWWDVPFPKKRKCFSKQNWSKTPKDVIKDIVVDEPETPEAAVFSSVIPGSSGTRLSDLIKFEQDKDDIEDKDTLNIRLSPYYNVTSPRASRASSSTSDEDRKDIKEVFIFNSETEGLESANGTLKTNCSSTIKSDILSSSFEYEDQVKGKILRESKSFECSPNSWYNPSHHVYPPLKKSEFTPLQLDKVHKIIEEATMRIESEKCLEAEKENSKDDTYDNVKKNASNIHFNFETEVKSGNNGNGKSGGVRTRRLSDTQVQYKENLENSFEVNSWKDASPYREKSFKSATRTPSIRRNQSESDVLWLREHESSQVIEHDVSPDVFVTTHRTIFTVSGDNESAPQVIATFLQDCDAIVPNTESNESCEQDLSDSTLKDDISLSSGTSSAYNHITEIKSKNKSYTERNKNDNRISDKRNKSLSCTQSPKSSVETPRRSHSSTPFSSPPVSPSFLNALCSPYHQNSPPVRSKKKILEAANEVSPTVKTMIDLYNKRITEKQELLINPFKPGDPYVEKRNTFINLSNEERTEVINDSEKRNILKSQSASVLQNRMQGNLNIQRSFSGTNEVIHSYNSSVPIKTALNPLNLISHPINYLGNEMSMELDASTEESIETCSESRVSSPQLPMDNDKVKLRAIRIKRAREEFLSRGKAPLHTENRLSSDYEDFSDGLSSEDHFQNGRESSVPLTPPPQTSSTDIRSCSEAPVKPPRTVELTQLSISHKESFRRQSDSCLSDEMRRANVVKSSSSGGIELRAKQLQGRPPSHKDNRKSSLDPDDNKRSSKGIFKLFKRSRGKDTKDLQTVQKLCRQSLAVDLSSKKTSTVHDDQQPSTSSYSPDPTAHKYSLEDQTRSSKTLPREEQHDNTTSTSRSCPSSPVALRKSKTAQLLEMGKNIFKSRSPSPSKRPR